MLWNLCIPFRKLWIQSPHPMNVNWNLVKSSRTRSTDLMVPYYRVGTNSSLCVQVFDLITTPYIYLPSLGDSASSDTPRFPYSLVIDKRFHANLINELINQLPRLVWLDDQIRAAHFNASGDPFAFFNFHTANSQRFYNTSLLDWNRGTVDPLTLFSESVALDNIDLHQLLHKSSWNH